MSDHLSSMTFDPTPGFDPAVALVVVDVQNDFASPEGSLFVAGGDEIVAIVNEEMHAARSGGATVVMTQDWHPPATAHFDTGGGSWPVHCVRGTWGAELVDGLDRDADVIVRKGTGGEDGYSAFTVRDPSSGATRPTGLAGYLRDRGVHTVVAVGLAADVCVSATARDAAAEGFHAVVPWRATRPVATDDDTTHRVVAEMRAAGVQVIGDR